MSVRDVIHVAEQLESLYQVVDTKTLMSLSEDFAILDEKINVLVGNSKEDANTSIQHFLCMNGDLDEEAWKKYINGGSAEPLRLSGYPYATLTKRLVEKEENNSSVFSKSLKAIDFGKGSIVVKKFKTQKGCYFVSLLHAGEQNYKYREEKYFPYLYGLFEIERMSGATRTKDASECKRKFKEEFKKQFDWKEAGYEEEELERLCGSDVTTAYKSVLLKDTWSYPKQDWLDFSISLSDNIMEIA